MILWSEDYPTSTGIVVSKAGINVAIPREHEVNRPQGFNKDRIFLHFTSVIEVND